VYFRLQGFQLVPAEPSELWAEIRSLRLGVFLPWFLAAMAIKLAGIFANVLRWQVLLRGQGIELGFGFLTRSYFIGRYFGILLPGERARRFAASAVDAATAYGDRRRYLVLALALAIVGQLTTTLMYFANAMSLAAQHVRASEVLFASAVMTFGTFVAPSASGEGVRELVFVWLLGSRAGAAKAFLIGNLGFWIEKIPLSVP